MAAVASIAKRFNIYFYYDIIKNIISSYEEKMEYEKYLIKAIAAESHFWRRIDKKYDEIGNFKVTRQREVLSVINELPPKALLRAIKLLVINESGADGQSFVADLLQKVYRKEIEFLINNKDTLTFEKFVETFGTYNQDTSWILRLIAIYVHMRKVMGLREDKSEMLQMIIRSENALDYQYTLSLNTLKMADTWLKNHGNVKSLNDLSYDEALFSDSFLAFETITKKENIPMRAFENYKITKNDIAEMIDIANSINRPYDLNKYLTIGFILKSLAKYANESKQAYLELALSEDASPTKSAKKEFAKLNAEIISLRTILNEKQNALNDLQLSFDRLRRQQDETAADLEKLGDYAETLEKQLDAWADQELESEENYTLPDFSDKKVIVMGGHANWQAKLHSHFSDFYFIPVDEFNFDTSVIKNADLIIFNFTHCSHKQFYRLRENVDKNKIIYVTNTNIDVLRRQIARKFHS